MKGSKAAAVAATVVELMGGALFYVAVIATLMYKVAGAVGFLA